MSGTRLVRAVLAADRDGLETALARDAAFNSPIRRYTSRAQVVHLLALIGTILPGARIERTWGGESGAATVFSVRVDGDRLDGVIEELYDGSGQVREVTLLLRPHAVMMRAIKRMAAALELEPLPG